METTKQQAKEILKKDFGSGIEPEEESVERFLFVKGTKKDKDGNETPIESVDIDKVTDFLLDSYEFKTIYSEKSELCYFYDNGIWNKKGKEIIKTRTERLLRKWARVNIVNEIYEKIKRKTEIDSDKFNKIPEGIVCLENGLFDLKNNKFFDYSSEYYFKSKLPIKYDKKKDCPGIKKFFEEVLYEEDVILIQEWFGYNLYNRYFKKKAVILFGEKDTGKTITMELLNSFLGENNIVSMSLQKIATGKSFDLLALKDKFANVFDDLGEKDLTDKGGFKIATGGGHITGEFKFGDMIGFLTFAKLTFATNKIPAVKDQDDDAYFDRWLPIKYDNQIQKENQDPFLNKKLAEESEISGLFNWAIQGLKRLIKNNGFSNEKSVEEKKEIMQRSSHHLTAFAQDCLEQKDGEKITKDLFFEVYSEWCLKNNKARFTKDKLGKNLTRFIPYVHAVGGKERAWLNISFKGNVDTYDSYLSFKGKQKSNDMVLGVYNKKIRVRAVKEEKTKDWSESDKKRLKQANKNEK